MEQQVYKFCILILVFVTMFFGCKSNNNGQILSIDKPQMRQPKDKNAFSVIAFRPLFEGVINKEKYESYCLDVVKNTTEPPFFKSFVYDDLYIDIVAPTFHKNYIGPDSNDGSRNIVRIMQSENVMNIVLDDSFIGDYHIYIDSLTFKEGSFYFDLANKKFRKISLEGKLKTLEKWKSSEGLLNEECINKIPLYKVIDSISDKNLIQDMLSLDFIKVSQDDLVTYDVLYNRREKERIRKARSKNKG